MLNPKQELFLCEYLKCGNAAESYRRAYGTGGNTAKANGARLLANPAIQERLRELQAEVANERICSVQEIQERLSSIARRELYEVVTLPNGEQVQRPTAIRDATRALELLAKASGMFVQRQEVDMKVTPVVIRDDI